MILTFSRLLDELLDGSKKQTIRKAKIKNIEQNPRFFNYFNKRKMHPRNKQEYIEMEMKYGRAYMDKNMPTLSIFWKNPRNGGMKIGRACILGVMVCHTSDLTDDIARLDGFKGEHPLHELYDAFDRMYGEGNWEGSTWEVVQWDWLEWPSPFTKEALKKKGLYP